MTDNACELLGLRPSFGFGDRTGLATAGHVAAMQTAGGTIAPIFPQQSIREMQRTGRTPEQVMRDAMQAARAAGWKGAIGADADHLKTPQDVDRTAAAGFTFFTIDPSEYVDQQADRYSADTLAPRYAALQDRVDWVPHYAGKTLELDTGTSLELSHQACVRAAVKYGIAIEEAIQLSEHIDRRQQAAGRPYEIELSVDETAEPTTLAEHYIIADQCLRRGMQLVSLAPRFVGDFEKGVDFRGDLQLLERSLADHAAIARLLGPYKLSLHSGSDKLSMYRMLARATQGQFHVKTAGTSYLEALRVMVRHDPRMFRELIDFARAHYDRDKATYHVSATLAAVPPPAEIGSSGQLEAIYLQSWDDVAPGRGFSAPGRQILHCTFGSVLTDTLWKPRLLDLLNGHPDTYREVLCEHFVRHLRSLNGA